MAFISKATMVVVSKVVLLGTILYYALEDGKVGAAVDRMQDFMKEQKKEKKRGREK